MKELEWSQHYSLIFLTLKGVSDGILPKFKPIQAFIVGLVICKNEEDPSKIEGTRVVTTSIHYKSMGFFPDAQGHVTHKSLVGSCRISNPFEILWLSLLPARKKKNKSKMKELEWSQDFPHYNPMGAICCHGNQSSDPILPKNLMQSIPHPNDAPDEI